MKSGRNTLFVAGALCCPDNPEATSLLVVDGTIVWLGSDEEAKAHIDAVDTVVNLDGFFVTPAFVDSHVHATSTGLRFTGIDLTNAKSPDDVLEAIRAQASKPGTDLVLGHGWDDSQWEGERIPSRTEIDGIAKHVPVYLSRVDVHSALVSTSLVRLIPDIASMAGFSQHAAISQAAHNAVRQEVFGRIRQQDRENAQRATLGHALAAGIVGLHEMAGPAISGESDARTLIRLANETPSPHVTLYWGELASAGGIDRAKDLGAHGVGGDLFIDGSLGSRTALITQPYEDDPANVGVQYLSDGEITDHIRSCTVAEIPTGFHVIGDAACSQVTTAFASVASELGATRLCPLRHRIEHAEMLTNTQIRTLAGFGITFSMQPLFDALWGSPSGMYVERLGRSRARQMNRFHDVIQSGGRLALGSDSPVTPMEPWSSVEAALTHYQPQQRLNFRQALTAHTQAAWQSIGEDRAGRLAVGHDAHLAIWQTPESWPSNNISNWLATSSDSSMSREKTEERDRQHPLSSLRCQMTVRDGECVYGFDFWTDRAS